jgi:hypothetical protein
MVCIKVYIKVCIKLYIKLCIKVYIKAYACDDDDAYSNIRVEMAGLGGLRGISSQVSCLLNYTSMLHYQPCYAVTIFRTQVSPTLSKFLQRHMKILISQSTSDSPTHSQNP